MQINLTRAVQTLQSYIYIFIICDEINTIYFLSLENIADMCTFI